MTTLVKKWWIDIDRFLLLSVLILLIIGIILSFSTNDQIIYSQKHLIYSFISIIIFLFLSFLHPKTIRRLALAGLLIFVFIMILILFMSYEVNGAKRWLQLWWGISVQPSEFLKPCFFVISAWFLSKGIKDQKFSLYIVFIFFLLLTTLLILQPDFGMTMLFAVTFFCQLFIAGLSITLVSLAVILLTLLFISAYYFFDHVNKRVDTWVQQFFDPDPFSQITSSLNCFKSGGLFGKGPGQGICKEKLPEAHTDFIFAVAGEEFGFIFCFIIVLLFLIIIIRLLLKLLKINNPFIIIAILGLICCFGLQALINILSSLDLIPTTGMTLPFISYGGSSMLSTAILIGFLLSLTKKNNNE